MHLCQAYTPVSLSPLHTSSEAVSNICTCTRIGRSRLCQLFFSSMFCVRCFSIETPGDTFQVHYHGNCVEMVNLHYIIFSRYSSESVDSTHLRISYLKMAQEYGDPCGRHCSYQHFPATEKKQDGDYTF